MNKDTATGLLLMGVILFGFMLCNRPKQDAAQNAQATEQVADSAKNLSAQALLGDADRAELIQTVKTYGTVSDPASKTMTLANTTLNLSVDSANVLSGTVKANGAEIPVADLFVSADSVSGLAIEQRLGVIEAMHQSVESLNKYKSFSHFLEGANDTTYLENKVMRVAIENRGGRICSVILKDYANDYSANGQQVDLCGGENSGYDFEFETADQRISTRDLMFKPIAVDSQSVLMAIEMENGAKFGLKYTINPNDQYLVKMDVVQQNMNTIIPENRKSMKFNWHLDMPRTQQGRTFEERNSAIYYKLSEDSPEDLSANADDQSDVNGNIRWVAFKNQYFSSVIVAKNHFTGALLDSKVLKDADQVKSMTMEGQFDYSSSSDNPASFDFFFGPNKYEMLSSLDEQISPDEDLTLTRLVPLGWGIFRWVNTLIIIPVFNFISSFVSNYGIVILLLTLFIKLILLPFTFKSYMSQARMRVLAPELKEINEKYPGNENAMRRQQETMKLYSRVGASPFSGCLPLLLQMPILIAVFSFIPSAIALRGESFLWAKDLAAPDVIFTLPFSIPFYGDKVSLFCLLMTVTNIIYTRLNMQNQPGGATMPSMKWMMYLMPVMFLFFFNDYASGLSYYYFLSLLLTIIQTYIFRRCINEEKVRAEMMKSANKPRKKRGFMARLEEAQKKQEAMMREQAKQNARRRR